ncbi:hypothetical protein BDV93DRAFT_67516 [Ceratobasidium sp. AG-I]|nr:hypothetical protein BDV93DRAFT_67516 [Ceratobasidium sp. AG-I]
MTGLFNTLLTHWCYILSNVWDAYVDKWIEDETIAAIEQEFARLAAANVGGMLLRTSQSIEDVGLIKQTLVGRYPRVPVPRSPLSSSSRRQRVPRMWSRSQPKTMPPNWKKPAWRDRSWDDLLPRRSNILNYLLTLCTSALVACKFYPTPRYRNGAECAFACEDGREQQDEDEQWER